MRGLRAWAALAVLSGLGLAMSLVDEPGSASAHLWFDIETEASVHHELKLDIEVFEPWDSTCSDRHIFVNDQPIRVTHFGQSTGEGTLPVENVGDVSAQWRFNCDFYPREEWSDDGVPRAKSVEVELNATALNGQPLVREAGFVATYLPIRPVQFVDVVPVGPLVGLVEIDAVLYDEEFEEPTVADEHGDEEEHDEGNHEKCHSLRCLMGSVTNNVKNKAEDIYEEVMAKKLQWQGHHNQHQDKEEEDGIMVQSTMSTKMKPITPTDDEPSAASATTSGHYLSSLPPPDQDLVLTLSIAIFFFTLFSILGIIAGTRRLAPHIQRRPRGHHTSRYHRETREERLARVAERRAAVGRFFKGLFCRVFVYTEKDDEAPQGRDLRSTGGHVQENAQGQGRETEETSMEEELANFRSAADMVSNMIAAEEGRNNRVLQQQLQHTEQPTYPHAGARVGEDAHPASVPDPIGAAYPGYFPGEAPPPSYENDSVDASMVADGFRYSPTSPATDNTETTQGMSNSDRLGYGNKD